jgi:hypothetical protein
LSLSKEWPSRLPASCLIEILHPKSAAPHRDTGFELEAQCARQNQRRALQVGRINAIESTQPSIDLLVPGSFSASGKIRQLVVALSGPSNSQSRVLRHPLQECLKEGIRKLFYLLSCA